MSAKNLLITQGKVYHSRAEGPRNSFSYPSYSLFFNCDDESDLLTFLKSRFRGLISFNRVDYLRGANSELRKNIREFLSEACNYQSSEVWLQTYPKVFGYAFNPVNFWHCRRDGVLEAMLVEVNNTFGERHFYWVKPDQPISPDSWYEAAKVFHVSPFFPVDGFYRFRFQVSEQNTRIDINYHAPDGKLRLATWVDGKIEQLDNMTLSALLKKYGWLSLIVVLRIHYQAIKLAWKRVKFFRKPPPPKQEVT